MSTFGDWELVSCLSKKSGNYFLEFPGKNDNINNCKEKQIYFVRMEELPSYRTSLPETRRGLFSAH